MVEKVRLDNNRRLELPKDDISGRVSPKSPVSVNGGNGIRRKLVVIGDGACGKTSMLLAYTQGSFNQSYTPTVFENYVASIQVDNCTVEMSLWDTAGQEDYDRLRPLSYPESNVIIICYAIDMPISLQSVAKKWIDEVLLHCEGVPRILVGCKSDLRKGPRSADEEPLVTIEEGRAMAEKIQAYKFLECSAKNGEGLQEVFEHATRAALLAVKKKRKATAGSAGGATSAGSANANSMYGKSAKKKSCSIV